MAVTSIWSIKGWIGKVINYAENPDKTKEQTSQELISESETGQLQGLNDVITYAVNAEKTRLRQSKSMEMEVVGAQLSPDTYCSISSSDSPTSSLSIDSDCPRLVFSVFTA